MNNNKLNKKFLKYIADNSPAYLVYNIDLRKAYDKAYEIVVPILKSQKNDSIKEMDHTIKTRRDLRSLH